MRDVRRLGSCALDLCHLAEGAADGYVEEGVQPWDYAAGAFIATQAGARCEMHPGAYGTPALVAAPEHGFDELLDAVRDAGFLVPEGHRRALEGGVHPVHRAPRPTLCRRADRPPGGNTPHRCRVRYASMRHG